MELYGLTNRGIMLARNVRSPDNTKYRIIHYLYHQPKATLEQIASYCGISKIEASREIRQLGGIVAKE